MYAGTKSSGYGEAALTDPAPTAATTALAWSSLVAAQLMTSSE